jgi:hypothetical protein
MLELQDRLREWLSEANGHNPPTRFLNIIVGRHYSSRAVGEELEHKTGVVVLRQGETAVTTI